jgi:GNAT superfamily N-acetyltransferase
VIFFDLTRTRRALFVLHEDILTHPHALIFEDAPPLLPEMHQWQHSHVQIRDAVPEDAPAACQVLKRSIAELCEADHWNDPAILARWLGNKTPENFTAWVEQADNSVLVAVENGVIRAVGSVTDAGTIGLNYVSPDTRFRGISRALLRALETRAAERGNARCRLTSTETARRFYLSNGYIEDGAPVGNFGTASGHPMSKALAVQKF